MNRKAIAAKWVVTAIFLLVSFLVIFNAVTYFFGKVNEQRAITTCRASVLLRDHIDSGLTREASPLLCKTIPKEIPKEKEDGELGVKKEMADMVKGCWYMFGNGQVENVFNNWFGDGLQNDCFICYLFDIEDIGEFQLDREEFQQYLDQTSVTRKQYDSEDQDFRDVELYTYTNYVQGSGGPGRIAIEEGQTFVKGEQYAVAFVDPQFIIELQLWKDLATTVTGSQPYATIVIDELHTLSNMCEIVKDEI